MGHAEPSAEVVTDIDTDVVINKLNTDGTTVIPNQAFGANKNIFPIPQAEIDKSGGILKQNDGY